MNKNTLLLIAGLLLIVFGTAPAQDKEVAAIKAAIERETIAFHKVDRKGWEDSWLQVPYAYWSYSDSTGTSFLEGYPEIQKAFDDYFKTQKSSRTIDVAYPSIDITIDRTWKEVRVYGNGAFAHYLQRVKEKGIQRDETSQIRVLEKKDGKWKIVCVGAIANYPKE